jgi:hypothetical protein
MYVVNALSSSFCKIVGGPLFLPKVLPNKWFDSEVGGMSKYLATVLSHSPASTAAIAAFNVASIHLHVLYFLRKFPSMLLCTRPPSSDLHGPWWITVSAGPSQKSSLLCNPPPMLHVGSGLSAKSGVPSSLALSATPLLSAMPPL